MILLLPLWCMDVCRLIVERSSTKVIFSHAIIAMQIQVGDRWIIQHDIRALTKIQGRMTTNMRWKAIPVSKIYFVASKEELPVLYSRTFRWAVCCIKNFWFSSILLYFYFETILLLTFNSLWIHRKLKLNVGSSIKLNRHQSQVSHCNLLLVTQKRRKKEFQLFVRRAGWKWKSE